MRYHFVSALLLCLVISQAAAARPRSLAGALARADARFTGFDPNRDGTIELNWVRPLFPEQLPRDPSRGLVVVIVEPRVLGMSGPTDPPDPALLASLRTHARDLAGEGWTARVVAVRAYDGPRHQDGRTVLAMREYLRAVREVAPDLAGTFIVGCFAEGAIVRQYNWRLYQPTTLRQGKPDEKRFGGRTVCWLSSGAELVAPRSDLMLADLDGHWDQLYHEAPEDLPCLRAVYPHKRPPHGKSPESEWPLEGLTRHYEFTNRRYEDFFFVNDGHVETRPWASGGIILKLRTDLQNEECSPADLARPNPITVPTTSVSRLDARHIALRPRADIKGTSGEGLLDGQGLPQTVTFAEAKDAPRGIDVWERDPDLERRLLVEYFARNHRYRHGAFRDQFLPAAAACGLDSFMPELRASRAEWGAFDQPGYDLQGEAATLLGTVEWLKRPAVVRAIAAHSDPWGAGFAGIKAEQVPELAAACGGRAWFWVNRENKLVPAFIPSGKLDFSILRSLWANQALPDGASFHLHSGCEITRPEGADSLVPSAPKYGYWQGAESMLFYAQGLAFVGRSKVFYDFPTGFAAELGAGKTFGEAWRHYYEAEASAADMEQVGGGIGRKRSYFWGLLGDWTLTLTAAIAG